MELHLWDYLQIILSRLPLALGVFGAVVILMLLYTGTRQARYEAKARILVERQTVNLTGIDGTDSGGAPGGDRQSDFMPTQLKLITARPVLKQALLKAGMMEHPEFQGAKDPIVLLERQLRVVHVRGSRLVDISVERADPEEAAGLVNAVVRSFIEDSRRRRLGISSDGLTELSKTADNLREQMKAATADLHAFLAKHNIGSFEESRRGVQDRLRGLNENLWRTEPVRLSLQAKVEATARAMAEGRSVDTLPDVMAAPVITQLTLELTRQGLDYAEMRNRLGENHPQLKSMELQREAMQTQIGLIASAILESVNTEYEQARKEADLLRDAIREQEAELQWFHDLAPEYDLLEHNVANSEQNHTRISERIEEIRINQLGGHGDHVFEVFGAEIPAEPSWPEPLQNILIGILAGGILAVVVCFFVDYMDTSIKSVDEVEALVGQSVLGLVPPVTTGGDTPECAVSDDPQGPVAEAFRIMRTALEFAESGNNLRSLAVTSCLPREGKTFTAVCLALSYAAAGKSVLLVDADLRKPRLHELFDLENDTGFATLLSGTDGGQPLADMVRPTSMPRLSLLSAGPIPSNPAELLDTPACGNVLTAAREQFDITIIDTPPASPVVDATRVGRLADAVIMVIRLHDTPSPVIRHVTAQFAHASIQVAGFVVNAVDAVRSNILGGYGGYGTYRGRYEYGYGNAAAVPGKPARKPAAKKPDDPVSSTTGNEDPALMRSNR